MLQHTSSEVIIIQLQFKFKNTKTLSLGQTVHPQRRIHVFLWYQFTIYYWTSHWTKLLKFALISCMPSQIHLDYPDWS